MRRLLFTLAALATLLVCSSASARAQVELYGTLSIPHVSNVETGYVCTGAGNTSCAEQYGSFTKAGIGGGVTINFLPVPVISLGFDLRGSTAPGTSGADTALFGLKLGAKVPIIHIKPYIQASGGYLATRTANVTTNPNGGGTVGGTFTNKYAVYEILGGVDYKLIKFVDFRIIEIGAGSSFASSPNANFVTINTGLVLHF